MRRIKEKESREEASCGGEVPVFNKVAGDRGNWKVESE